MALQFRFALLCGHTVVTRGTKHVRDSRPTDIGTDRRSSPLQQAFTAIPPQCHVVSYLSRICQLPPCPELPFVSVSSIRQSTIHLPLCLFFQSQNI